MTTLIHVDGTYRTVDQEFVDMLCTEIFDKHPGSILYGGMTKPGMIELQSIVWATQNNVEVFDHATNSDVLVYVYDHEDEYIGLIEKCQEKKQHLYLVYRDGMDTTEYPVIIEEKKVKKMNIAVVGTRDWADYDLLSTKLNAVWKKHPEATLVTGTPWVMRSRPAYNADKLSVYWARENNIKTILHTPDWNTYGKAAGPMRNTLIVADANMVIAFWDGVSTGTYDTLSKAFAAKIPAWVCTPRGETYKYDGRKPMPVTTKYPELREYTKPQKKLGFTDITPREGDLDVCKLCGTKGEGILCRECRR